MEFGENVSLLAPQPSVEVPPVLFRLSDSTGAVTFDPVEPPTYSSLSSDDAFLLDHSSNSLHPAIYIWIGNGASLNERRLAVQYAQEYLYRRKGTGKDDHIQVAISIVKMKEGEESEQFIQATGVH
jgi:Gelsolin repeat.